MGLIYGIRFKTDGRIYYVGQTIQKPSDRWRQHRNATTSLGKLLSLFGDCDLFEMVMLEEVEPADMDAREIHWIAHLGTCHPKGLNQNNGGAGGNSSPLGRERAAVRMREICARPGFKEKVSPIRRALWEDPEYRAKTLSGMAEAKARPGYGAKIGAHTKARWQKPGHRELVAASTKAEWADPEKKAAKSASIRRALRVLYDDPVRKAQVFRTRAENKQRKLAQQASSSA